MKKKLISGIIVTMFLVTLITFAIPVRVSAAFTGDPIYIGLVGPEGWIQWDGIKEAAEMSQDLINTAGGMDDGVDTHEVRLVEIDEHAVPVPDPTAAVTELLTALEGNPTMQLLVGGFRSECVFPMREAAMDYAAEHDRPIWVIAGAATNEIIDDGPDSDNPYDDVREDYERYKYMFRVTPMNSTNLFQQLGVGLLSQLVCPKLTAMFPDNTVPNPYYAYDVGPEKLIKAYIVAEDLVWCDSSVVTLSDVGTGALLGYYVVGVARPSAIETDFGPIFDAIEASGAKLIIPVFSAVAGATFTRQWGERKVEAVPAGINVESQMQEFYAAIDGKCEYETMLASVGTKSDINPNAKPLSTADWWDEYEDRYEHSPIYTAWGVYQFIMDMNWTATSWIGQSCSNIITIMETTTVNNPPGLLGKFKYTDYHDVFVHSYANTAMQPSWDCGAIPARTGEPGWTRAMIPQWQAGRLEVVWPRGYIFAPGSGADLYGLGADPEPLPYAMKYKVPPWMYQAADGTPLTETDFAGDTVLPNPPEHLAELFEQPAGFFAIFTLPDGEVGTEDMNAVTGSWQKTCPWNILEADMDGNQFIDIDDVARVALDWGKSVA